MIHEINLAKQLALFKKNEPSMGEHARGVEEGRSLSGGLMPPGGTLVPATRGRGGQ